MDFPEARRRLEPAGPGSVGSSTFPRLLGIGATVTVLDDFFTGLESNLPADDNGLAIVRGSVTDEDLVRRHVQGADYVFHMAARNIIVSTKNPREDFATNIGGTLNVLMAA